MNEGSNIMIVGDTHGDFSQLNCLIAKKRPEIVLSCGDFGYWPKFNKNTPKIHTGKIYFCDGNHEDFHSLYNSPSNEVWPNVLWMKRGSTLTLPDGRTVLFFGGADSIDRNMRTDGIDWFKEERITQDDLDNIPDIKIDIVVSHTCPMEFDITSGNHFYDTDNYCRKALSVVLEKTKPSEWYFGHWHVRSLGNYNGCKWTALNMAGEWGWWLWL
jgi:hypothetical protein